MPNYRKLNFFSFHQATLHREVAFFFKNKQLTIDLDTLVNFGEFLMQWDQLFGSFHDQKNGVQAGDVGLKASDFPPSFLKQVVWPFRQR